MESNDIWYNDIWYGICAKYLTFDTYLTSAVDALIN